MTDAPIEAEYAGDCGSGDLANTLMAALRESAGVTIPDIDITGPDFELPDLTINPIFAQLTRLSNDDLTSGCVDGSGTFDALMRGFNAHLTKEYQANRITGQEYTKAYIALTQGAMSNATQYLLGRDQAYWAAVSAQQQARIAEVQVILARVELKTIGLKVAMMQYETLNAEGNFALTKMKLATESMNYCVGKFNLEQLLPLQEELLQEQVEVQRAQTLDTRTDGAPIFGVIGKQKDLHTQQITSYKRDAEIKAARIFTDAWITMKTIDEGVLPPTGFTNVNLDNILTVVRDNNELVPAP